MFYFSLKMLSILRTRTCHLRNTSVKYGRKFSGAVSSGSGNGAQGYASLAMNPKPIYSDRNDDPSLWVRCPYPDVPTIEGVTMQELIWSTLGRGKDRELRDCLVREWEKFTYLYL